MSERARIAQLYPVELGVTGDAGNTRVLATRLERAGIPVETLRVGRGEALPADVDLLVIGNGPLSAMRGVREDLLARRDEIEALVAEGRGLLAIGGGAELLSRGVALLDGSSLDGLGILPFRVERTRERRLGYLIAQTPDGVLVGFEDHAAQWILDEGAEAYATVTRGSGSFDRDGGRGEGVRREAAYALNVQGPVLPLNPRLADALLSALALRRGLDYTPGEWHREVDRLAAGARAAIEERADSSHFTSMGL